MAPSGGSKIPPSCSNAAPLAPSFAECGSEKAFQSSHSSLGSGAVSRGSEVSAAFVQVCQASGNRLSVLSRPSSREDLRSRNFDRSIFFRR
jgi:hypothetical protein